MKLFFSIILLIISASAIGQVFQVHQGYCKKKDIEILTGDSIPSGFAIIRMGTFNKEEVKGTLKGLSKKQIKTMKTYCSWGHCCHVFIAFNKIQTFKNYNPGPAYYENKTVFYVLAPKTEVDIVK